MPIQVAGITIQDNASSTLAGSITTPAGTGALDVASIGSYADRPRCRDRGSRGLRQGHR